MGVIRERVSLPVDGGRKQDAVMRAVTVYRVDYRRKTKDPVGAVLEKRKTDRAHNYHDLLRLARRLFALDMADALHIVIDTGQPRRAALPELNSGCSAG
jgi:hypothetical protein